MTRTDTFVVGALVLVLALIAALVGVPALLPAATTTALPSTGIDLPVARPYREGVVGHPVSVSPLTARTQADRDLVAPRLLGLVRNGPSGTIVPDLAERWSVDASGAVWTFDLRRDADAGTTARPVTAEDVAFTIRTLQDAAYHGSGGRVVERGLGRAPTARRGSCSPWPRRSAASSRRPPSRSRRPTSSRTSRSGPGRRPVRAAAGRLGAIRGGPAG